MWFKRICAMGSAVLLTACATFSSPVLETSANHPRSNNEIRPGLEKARTFFREGKFNEAVSQYRRLIKSHDQNVAEISQYQIAFTLAYYKNPRRDFQEALNEYQLFIKRFPDSPLKEDAANWVSLLNQYLSKKSENEKLRDDIKKLVDIDIEAEQKQNQLR